MTGKRTFTSTNCWFLGENEIETWATQAIHNAFYFFWQLCEGVTSISQLCFRLVKTDGQESHVTPPWTVDEGGVSTGQCSLPPWTSAFPDVCLLQCSNWERHWLCVECVLTCHDSCIGKAKVFNIICRHADLFGLSERQMTFNLILNEVSRIKDKLILLWRYHSNISNNSNL